MSLTAYKSNYKTKGWNYYANKGYCHKKKTRKKSAILSLMYVGMHGTDTIKYEWNINGLEHAETMSLYTKNVR